MNDKIRPLNDRIVLKRIDTAETTKGGIIIPDNAKEKPVEGRVVAVGRGKTLDDGTVRAVDVRVGETVLFGKYSGTEIKLDGEDFLLVREDDILAVVNNT
jgi:chaperonin GroES